MTHDPSMNQQMLFPWYQEHVLRYIQLGVVVKQKNIYQFCWLARWCSDAINSWPLRELTFWGANLLCGQGAADWGWRVFLKDFDWRNGRNKNPPQKRRFWGIFWGEIPRNIVEAVWQDDGWSNRWSSDLLRVMIRCDQQKTTGQWEIIEWWFHGPCYQLAILVSQSLESLGYTTWRLQTWR